MRVFLKIWAVCAFSMIGLGCTESEPTPALAGNPSRLSEWGLFKLNSQALEPKESTQVYLPANQLFTDYANKLRTLYVPSG